MGSCAGGLAPLYEINSISVKNKLKKIKLIALDVDGVLTDGKIIMDKSGNELKTFCVQDGMGITEAQKNGLIIGLVSGRNSEVVDMRAKDLNIKEVHQGITDKKMVIKELIKKYNLQRENICFVGDDINDCEVKEEVGILFAVGNASYDLKKIADYICKRNSGEGAVREVIELILKAQNKWNF